MSEDTCCGNCALSIIARFIDGDISYWCRVSEDWVDKEDCCYKNFSRDVYNGKYRIRDEFKQNDGTRKRVE